MIVKHASTCGDPMRMTEPDFSPSPTLRGRVRAAFRRFAPSPSPRRLVGQSDAGALLRTSVDAAAAASSPTWRWSGELDSRGGAAAPDIAPEDWDFLFRAALELLARVAVEKVAPEGAGLQLQAPGAALRECMDALDQLRRSVPPHRTQHSCIPAYPDGEIASAEFAPAPGSIVEAAPVTSAQAKVL